MAQASLAMPFRILMALMFTFLPPTAGYGLIVLYIGVRYSGNLGADFFIMFFLLCVLFFYVRLAPKASAMIIATYLGFHFGLPYAVPLLGGLYLGISAAIPVVIGIFIWEMAPLAQELFAGDGIGEVGLSTLTSLPGTFSGIYKGLLTDILANQQWVFTSFVFVMVILVVFFISRTSLNYAKDIAIGAGVLMNLFGFMIASTGSRVQVNLGGIFILTVVSAVFTWIIRFFDVALDYKRTERVQFEDDEYYYFVKAVPKLGAEDQDPQRQPQATAMPKAKPKTAGRKTPYGYGRGR